jgi:o-succinylbenzoate---CoA ligase
VGGLGIRARSEVSSCRITRELTWDLGAVKSRFETEAITHVSLVPTQVFDLVRDNIRPPISMKALIVGGGFLNPEVALEAKKLGWPLLYSYGMTETSSMVSLSSSNFLEPLSGVKFRVRGDGQLGIQSSSLAEGRVCSLPEGQLTFAPLTEEDSWFWTEDRAQVTEEGIVLLGRHSDFVKIGGEGTDLQSLRQIHEAISMELSQNQKMDLSQGTAIWAIPSVRLGHEIQLIVEAAFQDLRPVLTEMQKKFNEQVLPNQRIRSTLIVSKIPRNELGKILWKRLSNVP